MESWVTPWFNADYLKLYPHRNQAEAERQVDFVLGVMHPKAGATFLDVGCGTGRHSIALAKRGYRTTGIDNSDFLLAQAKIDPSWPLSLQNIDIADTQFKKKFDHIVSMFTSFGYCDHDEDNVRILCKIAEHLKQGGSLFFDYLNPEWVKEELKPRETRAIDGHEVLIERKIEGDQVIKTIHFPKQSYQERVKLYTRSQLEAMLTAAGLTPTGFWGDFDGSSSGPRQLFFATRP